MKTITPSLLVAFIVFNIHCLFAQDIAEIPFMHLDEDFIELYKTLEELDGYESFYQQNQETKETGIFA